MYNFNPSPCEPDTPSSKYVAEKIKKRAVINDNKMKELLSKQFNTTDFPRHQINNIKDFPLLKKKELCRKLFLGTFPLKQSKSYLSDLLKNGKCYFPSTEYLKNIRNKHLKTSLK